MLTNIFFHIFLIQSDGALTITFSLTIFHPCIGYHHVCKAKYPKEKAFTSMINLNVLIELNKIPKLLLAFLGQEFTARQGEKGD